MILSPADKHCLTFRDDQGTVAHPYVTFSRAGHAEEFS